ncbi:phosphoribosylamine--glycine ligase [Amphibiibacter pelophylacis]|uniref:Phosphoribosylamine--glycine ligase n=1 Tax=Amphibiibacter pelophylacis TaxID=1799477 RepID=A0ACC6P586_9BURK
MKVMVIGSGGREHALAWKLAQGERVEQVYVAPGNGGTVTEAHVRNVDIAATDVDALVAFAQEKNITLTVVGPEAALAAGVVDAFRRAGLAIFGPTQSAARLETSKRFAKDFMARHHIPTARYATFTEAVGAHAYVDAEGVPIVVKADGLAAGKGVVVAMTLDEAHAAIDDMLALGQGSPAGEARVVIEEFLEGEEASFMVLADGRNVISLATSQDHKRLLDHDQGPNTGGMGAYSPAPVVTPNVHARVMKEIIKPTLAAMAAEGVPFTGFLYAGLMIDAQGHPRTLEFNTRMGDPETQPILMRLKSDLAEVLLQAAKGQLPDAPLEWDRRCAVGVVMAAPGYPQQPVTGQTVEGLDRLFADGTVQVFHAGTQRDADGQVRVSGGRVLCVTALGDNVRLAQQAAYEAVRRIQFEGVQFRSDIAHRAVRARPEAAEAVPASRF